jgi:hypothetical protein
VISVWQRSASASLSARVSSAGKNPITLGSALSAAKDSRSAVHHCRNRRRSVSNSIGPVIFLPCCFLMPPNVRTQPSDSEVRRP